MTDDVETVEVRLLGPVEVRVSGSAIHLSRLEQGLLATLALVGDRPVPVERIIAALWGETPPASARNRVQALVSGVRRALGAAAGRLTTTTSGYRLDAEVDLFEFELLAGRARQLASEGRYAEAAAGYRDAFELWRGDVPELPARSAELEELRLTVLAERFDAELALGQHTELVGQLSSTVAEHPHREGFVAQLMLALYRSGRHPDALAAYRRLRSEIAEEFGLDPGPELSRLHDQILRRDPELDLQPVSRPAQLPRDVPDFTGRSDEVMELLHADPDHAVVISALDGMGGVGKTALTVYAGHRLAPRFPDGQLFVDLRGHAIGAGPLEPDAALDFLLRSVGVPAERIPTTLDERAALWRSELAGRRMLIVLDNAANPEQVTPLLPGKPGCLVLITSRSRMADLDGAHLVSLDVLPENDAIALFVAIVGERASNEPDATAEVVEMCGRLPLAIRIAASRLRDRPRWTVAHLAGRLRDRSHRLTELSSADRAVSAAFELSYRQLDQDQRRLFRLLGLHPGTAFDGYAAAAVAGVPLRRAEDLLESLVDVHLMQQHAPDRYRFHDLMRDHARGCAAAEESKDSRRIALHRLLDYYLQAARLAADVYHPGREAIDPELTYPPDDVPPFDDVAAASDWFERERQNLLEAVWWADQAGLDRHAWLLPREICGYLLASEHFADCIDVNEVAVAAARRSGDLRGEQLGQLNLTNAYWRVGRVTLALDIARSALETAKNRGDGRIEAFCHGQLALISGRAGDRETALRHFDAVMAMLPEHGLQAVAGHYLTGRAFTLVASGRYDEALADANRAIELNREYENPSNEADAHVHAAMALGRLGRYDEAFAHLDQGASLAQEAGRPTIYADALRERAQVLRQQGRYDEAFATARSAQDLVESFNRAEPECELHLLLGQLHGDVGNDESSLMHYQRALELARRIGYRLEEAAALDGIAHVTDRTAVPSTSADPPDRRPTIRDSSGNP